MNTPLRRTHRSLARWGLPGPAAPASRGLNSRLSLRAVELASLPLETVLATLQTTPDGLSAPRAGERRVEYGSNDVAHERPPRWYVQLLHAFRNPFIILLLVLAVVSYLTDDLGATIIISVMVLISVLLRFFQEYRSTRAAEQLKAMVRTTATVSRPDPRRDVPASVTQAYGITLHPQATKLEQVPIQLLVPGDVIRLSAGDMVPADVRLLSSRDLFISQSILSGESLPVENYDVLGAVAEKSARASVGQVPTCRAMAGWKPAPRPPGRWTCPTSASWGPTSSAALPGRSSWPRAPAHTSAPSPGTSSAAAP
jgi:Mg2+-importing ATPase